MKKFYLNRNFSNPLSVELSPTLVETLDESLDNMTVSLGINANRNPYAPVLNLVGVYEEDENQNRTLINEFVISADNVEIATENPLRYKHTVSLIQKSQFLTKHLIRNNVFSQSLGYATQKKYLIGGNFVFKRGYDSMQNNMVSNQIKLNQNKIKGLIFDTSFLCFKANEIREVTQTYATFIINDTNAQEWDDVLDDNTATFTYPQIIFSIGIDTRTWQLGNIKNNEKIEVPQEIIDWINTYNSGTLEISVNPNFPNSGWIYSPIHYDTPGDVGITCPVYGKLTFDVSLLKVEKNIFEIIEELINQYKKNTKAYNDHVDSSGYDSTIKPLFKMPDADHQADLYELLINTQAPNLIFTQSSMFDALSEIFRLWDATFRIDEDGYLEIEYFNERKTEDKITMTDSKQAGRSSSLGEERYANRLVTFFQNTKINDRFPNSNNENATAYLRSKTLGVPGESDFVFVVPKPIDFINKVTLKTNINLIRYEFSYTHPLTQALITNNLIFNSISLNNCVDITNNVVESNLWSILPSDPSVTPYKELCQENALSFEKGTNYINCSAYYNITNVALYNKRKLIIQNVITVSLAKQLGTVDLTGWSTDVNEYDWSNIKMSIDYIALVDGKLVSESIDNKYDGEILTNQNNGSIDIYKLGLNMVGLSLKLGQPTLTMTQRFTNWTNRIKKGQWFVDQTDGSIWVANNCSYTLVTNYMVQATIEFVKNFNSLASRIELNREKRLSNISNELTVKCEENYGEFIYFSDNINYIPSGENIALTDLFLQNTLRLTLNVETPDEDKIEYALVTALDSDNNVIALENGNKVENIAIPMVVYGSGNSVCFEMSFESPISAGAQLLDNYTSSFWSGGWFSRAVLYSREDGTADKFTIQFIDLNEDTSRLFPVMKKQIVINTDYSDSNLTDLDFNVLGKLEEFEYFKKPNEIFALNYQLHFLPYKTSGRNECFLGGEFIKNNGFSEGLNKHKLKFIYTLSGESDFEYSILDTKGQADHTCDFEIDDEFLTNGYALHLRILFNVGDALSIKTWAIVDENNNLYFSSNNPLRTVLIPGPIITTKFYADLVFVWRHHRLV